MNRVPRISALARFGVIPLLLVSVALHRASDRHSDSELPLDGRHDPVGGYTAGGVGGEDCNDNGIPDDIDVLDGTSDDCDENLVPDECQLGDDDCNENNVPDECDTLRIDYWETFDGYLQGSQLIGQGGWDGWNGNPTVGAFVSNERAHSTPLSVEVAGATALVRTFTGADAGLWTLSAWQYIPSSFSGNSYLLLLNTYSHGGAQNWSGQIHFNSATGRVISDFDIRTLPIITDEWVQIRFEINLDANVQRIFYGDTELAAKSWTNGLSGGGASNIAALGLFANGATSIYYDDIVVAERTGDCNANGVPDECELNGADCNDNGIDDACDINACFNDPSCSDCNSNGVPDGCDPAGPGSTPDVHIGDWLIGSRLHGTIFAIDPESGLIRGLITGRDLQSDCPYVRGEGETIANIGHLALLSMPTGRLFARRGAAGPHALYEIDVASGDRIGQPSTDASPWFESGDMIALDDQSILTADDRFNTANNGAILRYDLQSGTTSVVSGRASPGATTAVGDGPLFNEPRFLCLIDSDTLAVAEWGGVTNPNTCGVFLVDLPTGNRTFLSRLSPVPFVRRNVVGGNVGPNITLGDNEGGSGPVCPNSLLIRSLIWADGRLIVAPTWSSNPTTFFGSLIEINTENGDRTLLVGDAVEDNGQANVQISNPPANNPPFIIDTVSGLSRLPDGDLLWVDLFVDKVFRYDLVSRELTIAADIGLQVDSLYSNGDDLRFTGLTIMRGPDCDEDTIPDSLEPDGDGDGIPDDCEKPDLTINAITAPPTGLVGQSANIQFTISNSGGAAAIGTWSDSIFLSPDGQIGSDIPAGVVEFSGSLGAGQSYDRTVEVTLPETPGTYRVVVSTDDGNSIEEAIESNNAAIDGGAIVVTAIQQPDLEVVSIVAPPSAETENAFELRFRIKNLGNAPAVGPWTNRVYFSYDDQIGGDLPAASFGFVGVLAPGAEIEHIGPVWVPGTPHTYRLVVAADINNTVTESNESNNSALGGEIAVGGAPTADLKVLDVDIPPGPVNSGTDFQINWTVTNDSAVPTFSPQWFDQVLISESGDLDFQEGGDDYELCGAVVVGSAANPSYLGGGDSYQQTAHFTLPNHISGLFYVYVVTDRTACGNSIGQVPEANEANNLGVSPSPIQVNLEPQADLQATLSDSIFYEVYSGDNYTVKWVDRNDEQGGGPTSSGNWIDSVYLSTNSNEAIDEGDFLLGSRTRSGPPLSSGSADPETSVTGLIPTTFNGAYFIKVDVNVYDSVSEIGFEHNNIKVSAQPLQVIPSPAMDLVFESIDQVPAGIPGHPLTVSYSAYNQGNDSPTPRHWVDRVYLSTDVNFDPATDQLLATISKSTTYNAQTDRHEILPYAPIESPVLPIYLDEQDYFILIVLDATDHLFEADGENINLAITNSFSVQHVPTNLEIEPEPSNPSSAAAGQAVQLAWLVTNSGQAPTPVAGWHDAVHLSTDAELDPNDTLLDIVHHSGLLQPSAEYTAQALVTIPSLWPTGPAYFIFTADALDTVYEHGEGEYDNSAAGAVQVTPIHIDYVADLDVAAPAAPPPLDPGQSFMAEFTITNIGNAPTSSTAWTDRLYLSTDGFLGPEDTLIASVARVGELAEGASYAVSRAITAPDAGGDYYVFLRVDVGNIVFEASESNNIAVIPFEVTGPALPYPNLEVTDIDADESTVAGGELSVTWSIQNSGELAIGSGVTWRDAIYLSSDTALSPNDLLLGTHTQVGPLATLVPRETPRSFPIPCNAAGAYHVIVLTDSQGVIAENGWEDDNVLVSGEPTAITGLGVPNLDASPVEIPPNAGSGQSLTVSLSIENTGGGLPCTSQWTDTVYLSRDMIPDPLIDAAIGSIAHNEMLPSGPLTPVLLDVTIPPGASGPYYVILVADSLNQLAESNEIDNIEVSEGTINVALAPPGDLTVSSIITTQPGYLLGQNAEFSWEVHNTDTQNAVTGARSDSVYLSDDEMWSIDDVLVMRFPFASTTISPQSFTISQGTAPIPAVRPGPYFVIVRADILNQIPESNNSNNEGTSAPATITVDTRELFLNDEDWLTVPMPVGSLQYFSLTVEEANDTVDIIVDHESETAWTEVYVKKGEIPTFGDSDFRSDSIDQPDHVVSIPTTEAGTYYILARTTFDSNSANGNNMSIRAQSTEFGITTALPSRVGNGDHVTIRIDGTRFGSEADPYVTALSLQGVEGPPIHPAEITVVDGRRLRARFDLSAAALGSYDVQVTDLGGQSATLDGAVTIETARPIEASITGSGNLEPRADGSFQATGTIVNIGNVDARYVTVLASFDANVAIGWQEPTGMLPRRSDFNDFPDWELNSPTAAFSNGHTSDAIYLRDVAPGEEVTCRVLVRQFDSGPFDFRFSVHAGTYEEFAADFFGRLEAARQLFTTMSPAELSPALQGVLFNSASWKSYFEGQFANLGFFDQPPHGSQPFGCEGALACSADESAWAFLSGDITCSPAAAASGRCDAIKALQVQRGSLECHRLLCSPQCGSCAENEVDWNACPPAGAPGDYFTSGSQACGQAQAAIDPNEKIGPVGGGNGGGGGGGPPMVSAGTMQYGIHFQNEPNATAAASRVTITDDIDPKLALGSFRLGTVRLGDLVFTEFQNRSSFQRVFDLTESKGIHLRVTAGVNATTRRAEWVFESIDPVTGQPPTDPNRGILPPDDGHGIGTGYIELNIRPMSTAPTGGIVPNRARITLDTQPTIVTNTVYNTLDMDAPTSTALATIEPPESTTVQLNWTGFDPPGGSGLKDCSIFFIEQVSPTESRPAAPVPGLVEITEPVGYFTAQRGRQYLFYSRARDFAGNVESASGQTGATIVVPLQTPGAPVLNLRTAATVTLSLANLGGTENPPETEYALFNLLTAESLSANGRLGSTPIWRTADAWGPTLSVRALFPNDNYEFALKPRTAFSEGQTGPSLAVTTQPQGDVNGDGIVTNQDVLRVLAAMDTAYGDPSFDPAADLNRDNIVDISDHGIVTSQLPCTGAYSGDFDNNGIPSMGDVPGFVNALLNPTSEGTCLGDVNEDGVMDGKDVQPFVDGLL